MSKQELNLHRQVQLSCDAPAGRLDDRKKDNVDLDLCCCSYPDGYSRRFSFLG